MGGAVALGVPYQTSAQQMRPSCPVSHRFTCWRLATRRQRRYWDVSGRFIVTMVVVTSTGVTSRGCCHSSLTATVGPGQVGSLVVEQTGLEVGHRPDLEPPELAVVVDGVVDLTTLVSRHVTDDLAVLVAQHLVVR